MGDRQIHTHKAGVTNSSQGRAITHARELSLLVRDGSTRASRQDAGTHRRAEVGTNARAAVDANELTERVSGIGR